MSVSTAFVDVASELREIRQKTAHEAADILQLELERCDQYLQGLWPAVRRGDARAVGTAVRVGERRARLLGLDAAVRQDVRVEGAVQVHPIGQEQANELLRLMTPEEIDLAYRYQTMAKDVEERLRARRAATHHT